MVITAIKPHNIVTQLNKDEKFDLFLSQFEEFRRVYAREDRKAYVHKIDGYYKDSPIDVSEDFLKYAFRLRKMVSRPVSCF